MCGQEMRSRTNVHYLVFHLTLADTITSYVTLPMETLWRQGQIIFQTFAELSSLSPSPHYPVQTSPKS